MNDGFHGPALPQSSAPAALIPADVAPDPTIFRWVEYSGQAQHGIAGTHDRDLWLVCIDGRLHFGAPLGGDLEEGDPLTVTIGGSDWTETLKGSAIYRGDGMNADIEIPRNHPLVRTLMQGFPVHIAWEDYGYDVPGDGASVVLGPLVDHCTPG